MEPEPRITQVRRGFAEGWNDPLTKRTRWTAQGIGFVVGAGLVLWLLLG